MKSVKDYLKKYEGPIMKEYDDKLVVYQHAMDMFIEINQELKFEFSKVDPNLKDLTVFGRLIKETNDRWNAIDKKWIKKHGESPFKRDAVYIYWVSALPEVRSYIPPDYYAAPI